MTTPRTHRLNKLETDLLNALQAVLLYGQYPEAIKEMLAKVKRKSPDPEAQCQNPTATS